MNSPLSSPVFRALWLATIVSNIGTWMHDVGAAWLMTSLSPSPLMVALVQAATTFPLFLLALPAGALADIIDRRKVLIGAQLWTLCAAGGLAAVTLAGWTSPALLLGFTLALACGAAMSAPAFQASVPELVPREALTQAVALNSTGINIARAIGPALGGVIIAAAGSGAVFALNAVSVIGVLIVLWRWRRAPGDMHLPPERFGGALAAGLRFAVRAPALQVVLVRALAYFLFASALWALLPVVARRELGLDALGYGVLLTALGCGAVAGALLLPWVRRRVPVNALTVVAALLFAGATAALALVPGPVVAAPVLVLAGMAWIAMMAALNGAAQLAVPGWVKARALAIYLLVFQGSMTAGAALWGSIALHAGTDAALFAAAGGLVVALIAAWRFPLSGEDALDLAPSLHWGAPVVAGEIAHDRGPVLVTIEYRVDPDQVTAFARAMAPMQRVRRRDGASGWGLYEDAAMPGLMIESFTVPSWVEHLRQHVRVTNADRTDQDAARAFHLGPQPPVVRHWIAPS